jgi:hypothetical protein
MGYRPINDEFKTIFVAESYCERKSPIVWVLVAVEFYFFQFIQDGDNIIFW